MPFLSITQPTIHYSAVLAFITCTWSAGRPDLRCRQSLGENTEAELRESTGKLICVKAPLKKGRQCAIVDFKKEHVVVIFCIHFDDINIKRLWA